MASIIELDKEAEQAQSGSLQMRGSPRQFEIIDQRYSKVAARRVRHGPFLKLLESRVLGRGAINTSVSLSRAGEWGKDVQTMPGPGQGGGGDDDFEASELPSIQKI